MNPEQLLHYAVEACRNLIALLEEENACLAQRDLRDLDEITRAKERMSVKLEKHLAEIKQHNAELRANPEAQSKLVELKHLIAELEDVASHNLVSLQAKHTATLTFVNAVRASMAKPGAQTYTRAGHVSENQGQGEPLVKRSV